ncbi:PAS domain-containing protein, partial [Streptomyces scabiei]|uniref:PAS domain-containing protein n=1 Tax=Streptomyces scabiei TaxID=1930 RepID=UPI0029903610
MSASRRRGTTDELGPDEPERNGPTDKNTKDAKNTEDADNEGTVDTEGTDGTGGSTDPGGSDLLAALLDGMDAALCAFDADGVVTHWNREAERILGWSAEEAVGRRGFAGWAVRTADAEEIEGRLMAAMHAAGRQVHEFALVTKDGGRVLVRTQSAAVPGPDGKPAGLYCAFSEVHAQIDLERSIALSEALFEDASWGVVLVDADLRPAVVNAHAARSLGIGRTSVLGRPLGELLAQGVEELESALTHVLAEGAPPAPAEIWVGVRTPDGEKRRCWRSGFLRLASPLAEEPVPLGVGWLFQDVTETKQGEQEAAQLRFRVNQLHRAARAAAECEDPGEAATVHLDFALAGFADHALIDRISGGSLADGEGPARLVAPPATPPGRPFL